jgi:FkbM family methyltransferase
MSVRIIGNSIWGNPGNRGHRVRKSFDALLWQAQKHTVARCRKMRLANQIWFMAHPDCVVSSALVYADWPEYHELMFLRSRLRPAEVLIDVGAYVGHFSLLLADKVRPEDIYTFEPLPVNSARLIENWKLNGWSTANHTQAAVGSSKGTVYVAAQTIPSTVNQIATAPAAEGVAVPMVALDDRMTLWKDRRIGLIKIDVEGYEAEVFRGSRKLLKEQRPRMVIFESLGGSLVPGVGEVLAEAGYKVFQLDVNGRPDFSGDAAENLFAVPEESAAALLTESER